MYKTLALIFITFVSALLFQDRARADEASPRRVRETSPSLCVHQIDGDEQEFFAAE